MIPRRCAILISLAVAACASGSTMRVAQEEDEDTSGYGPVALAPTPQEAPDTTPEVSQSDTAPAEAPAPATPTNEPPAAQPEAQGYAPYGNETPLDIRRIGQWTRTGIDESRRLVIRDANAWADFWSELGVGERPSVDFSRDIVVVAAAGQRPTGGYEIAVDRVTNNGGELTAEVVETTPGPNCMTTASLTQPVDVVVVPGVAPRSWSFVERKEIRGCR